jgi:hydrogenase maturation protease
VNTTRPLVVLGIGNTLLGDDGVGVHATDLLAADPSLLPAGTTVLDGGTGGLSLLPAIADAGALVIVDAIDVDAAPGHIRVLTGIDLHAEPGKLSVHEVGTADLLAAARLTGVLPESTALIGIQPATLSPSITLSPPVAAALPELLDTVRRWCAALTATVPTTAIPTGADDA